MFNAIPFNKLTPTRAEVTTTWYVKHKDWPTIIVRHSKVAIMRDVVTIFANPSRGQPLEAITRNCEPLTSLILNLNYGCPWKIKREVLTIDSMSVNSEKLFIKYGGAVGGAESGTRAPWEGFGWDSILIWHLDNERGGRCLWRVYSLGGCINLHSLRMSKSQLPNIFIPHADGGYTSFQSVKSTLKIILNAKASSPTYLVNW